MSKTYFIQTLGCQQNHSDSERVASVFSAMGYSVADTEQVADVIVVNSCAVRQSSMDRVYGKLRHWRPRQEKGQLKTILTGCILAHDRQKLGAEFDHVVNIEDISKIPNILGEEAESPIAEFFSVEPKHHSEFQAFVPIMTGCDKFCTYCAVPYTRGREISRPAQDILNEVTGLVRRGYKEIILLGQNVNSYAGLYDQPQEKRGLMVLNRKRELAGESAVEAIDFPKLLSLVAEIPGDFWIRYTSPHPYDMSDELIEVMAKYEKVAKYINFPLQSGDDDVLKRMNRHYSVEHYFERLAKLRSAMPDIFASTDIIVGFCGETEEQFNRTAEALRRGGYDMAFINQYSPRPSTVAERKFEDTVSIEEKHRRERVLNEILKASALANGQQYIGQTVRMLVDEVVDKEGGLKANRGKTFHGKSIQFTAARSYLGQFVDARVVSVKPFSFHAELV